MITTTTTTTTNIIIMIITIMIMIIIMVMIMMLVVIMILIVIIQTITDPLRTAGPRGSVRHLRAMASDSRTPAHSIVYIIVL